MPRITLPDGSVRDFDKPVSAFEVASDIGKRLAKDALGCKVDGVLSDLGTTLSQDCNLSIVTPRNREGDLDEDGLYLLRHSGAHVMAEAIQGLFPEALLVYGPPVDHGFYYDIAFPEGKSLSSDDFEKVEKEMQKIVKENRRFTRYDLPLEEGMAKLKGEGSKYKLDNAEKAVEAGSSELSWYATGEPGKHWEDLCRGPHAPSTGRIQGLKVLSVAASYWHGDAASDHLTRVYGTAFPTVRDLDVYLHQLEEAKKRDHREIGKRQKLFVIDEQVGQGLILWTPRGSILRKELQDFIGAELTRQGYEQVFTPHIGKLDLFRTSGHFPYYKESQYAPIPERDHFTALSAAGCSCADLAQKLEDGEAGGYLLKPMNCPFHIGIYRSEKRSYRDLPVRLAEFGTVYRWEQSGEISGMTRVRGFTQDDAHIFCTEDQVAGELTGCLDLVKVIFKTLGMKDYRVRVGLRDTDSSKYIGSGENWDRAEEACRDAAKSLGAPFSEEPGEAAFYGPKIDFVVKDVIGREWQLGTVQVDYNLPNRFKLNYTGADNQSHRPVMIHRAPFGSMERFCGVLIEHFAGAFPLWLSPEQVRVLPISEKTEEYAEKVNAAIIGAGARSTVDHSSERLQAKIRNGAEMKIPYLLIVGPRDAEAGQVSVRARGTQKDLGAMDLWEFVEALSEEIRTRGATTVQEKFPAEEAV